jgi:hypothetical protein
MATMEPGTGTALCCPRFDPAPWDRKEVTWTDRLFVKGRVHSILHIPLDFGAVMRRTMARIEAAGAAPAEMIVLADENSLWGADVYVPVTREVAGASMTRLSGTFLCRVFEGPYSQSRAWVREMATVVQHQGRQLRKLYFLYTACPRCAKAYGKNYFVLLAQV